MRSACPTHAERMRNAMPRFRLRLRLQLQLQLRLPNFGGRSPPPPPLPPGSSGVPEKPERPTSDEKKEAGGNGRDKGAEKVNAFIDGLSQLKKSALTHAMTSYNEGDMGIDEVNAHLKASGFIKNEIVKARLIVLGEVTT
jgi:hypothetical protein